jgi:hypothetical protein
MLLDMAATFSKAVPKHFTSVLGRHVLKQNLTSKKRKRLGLPFSKGALSFAIEKHL